jgi:hypothetical protein
MKGLRNAANGGPPGPRRHLAYDPPPPSGRPVFDPPPPYPHHLDAVSPSRRRAQMGGVISVVTGLIITGLAFAGQATASLPAATSVASCSTSGWTDTVTVTNSPVASNGPATISGTGTALDGATLAAGGGQHTVALSEPLTVASVTVSGTLSWPQNYVAPFRTTATNPGSCAPAGAKLAVPAVQPLVDTPSVTLCHATNSNTNPYVSITVDAAGAFNGHLGHTGPVWDPTLKGQGIQWGDIIPPFVYNDQTYSLNWPAGEDFWNNACNIPPPTVTTTVPGPTTTVPGPTVTVTGPTTTVTVTTPVTETATVTTTAPAATVTIPGPTTTVSIAGPTVTLTETATETETATATSTVTQTNNITTTNNVTTTATVTQTNTVTQINNVTQTNNVTTTNTVTVTASPVTVTAAPVTETQTVVLPAVTVTQTVPGCVVGNALLAVAPPPCPTATVTQVVTGPGATVTVTEPGSTVTAKGATVTVTAAGATSTVTNCPPGSGIQGASGAQGGSLAFTGSGNDPLMSLIGGALTAAGLTCLIMARKRRGARAH